MKGDKRQKTTVMLLLALILVTLAVFCVVLITNRLQPTEQTASNQQQLEETEQAEVESPDQLIAEQTTPQTTPQTENLSDIGKKAADKWSEIGYSFTAPLYFTDLSKLSQENLRLLYSAYLYYHDLFDTDVTEQAINNTIVFWTAKDGLVQFAKDYFNLSFDEMPADMDAGSVDNEKVAFYFNARFNTMDSNCNSFTFLDCVQNEDGTYQLSLQANTDYPLIGEYNIITNHSIQFFVMDGEIYFLYAEVE